MRARWEGNSLFFFENYGFLGMGQGKIGVMLISYLYTRHIKGFALYSCVCTIAWIWDERPRFVVTHMPRRSSLGQESFMV